MKFMKGTFTALAAYAADLAHAHSTTRDLAEEYRMILNVEGVGTDAGTLDDVNAKFGTNITLDDAFPEVTLGDLVACLEFPVYDLESKESLGTGTDCIYGTDTEGAVATILFFEFDCGLVVHHGLVSLGNFTEGVGDNVSFEGGPVPNTLTGSIPDVPADNSILDSSGDFDNATGYVRVSGAIHLGESVAFDCLMDVYLTLENEPSCGLPATETSSEIFTSEDSPTETTGRGVVQFLGAATTEGTLEEVSQAVLGESLTPEMAFGDFDLSAAEATGCHKMPLVDFLTKEQIGDGYDCLWLIEGGVAAVGIYDFGDGNVIVNSGLTSLAPFVDGFGNGPVDGEGSPNVVVMSGSVPPELDGDTFVATSGKFDGWEGNIRLSGAAVPPSGEDGFWFNCIWEITLVNIPETVPGTTDEPGTTDAPETTDAPDTTSSAKMSTILLSASATVAFSLFVLM